MKKNDKRWTLNEPNVCFQSLDQRKAYVGLETLWVGGKRWKAANIVPPA